MMNFHANILKKNGEKEFVVIPYEVFVQIQEELDDYESLKALRAAKSRESNAKTISLSQAKKKLKIS